MEIEKEHRLLMTWLSYRSSMSLLWMSWIANLPIPYVNIHMPEISNIMSLIGNMSLSRINNIKNKPKLALQPIPTKKLYSPEF